MAVAGPALRGPSTRMYIASVEEVEAILKAMEEGS